MVVILSSSDSNNVLLLPARISEVWRHTLFDLLGDLYVRDGSILLAFVYNVFVIASFSIYVNSLSCIEK